MLRLACLLACLLALTAWADPACRIAFDVGSSGVRAGADVGPATARTDIDYLGDLWADRRIDSTLPESVRAFRELPRQAGFPAACARVAGGFSAWRLALELAPAEALAATLARLYRDSGVALLVIPQPVEGRYGHVAARRQLGAALRTSHILDIGGGSLQVAGQDGGQGWPLGQKAWNRLLCGQLRPGDGADCALPGLDAGELAAARRLLAERLHEGAAALPAAPTLTAISRPVSRGIYPALQRLAAAGEIPADAVDERGFVLAALPAAIARLAPSGLAERQARSGVSPPFAAYLLSDLILVEGVLRAIGAGRLEVAEADITNLPGLLEDDRAYAWASRYGCYLARLREMGVGAYEAELAGCGR